MGDDVPIDPPEPGEDPCSGCCDDMPPVLFGRLKFNIGAMSAYEGLLTQFPVLKCSYSGLLTKVPPPGDLTMFVNYCVGDVNILTATCAGIPACHVPGRNVVAPHFLCYPIVSANSIDGAITFSVS